MEILEQLSHNQFNITACDGFKCVINQKSYQQSFILYHNQIIPWNIDSINAITPESLEPILSLHPDCVIIGTGIDFHFLENNDYPYQTTEETFRYNCKYETKEDIQHFINKTKKHA